MLNKASLIQSLQECGIKQGEIILVTSNISLLGKTEGTLKDGLQMYYDALREVVGEEGTIVVPAYFYDYSKGIPFDVKKTPVSRDLGLFSQFITSMEASVRSLNPFTSLAAVGPKALLICGGKTASSYGIDSAFDRLYKAKAKMLFLGVDLQFMTFVHYAEHEVGVPHRYTKYFKTPIYNNGALLNYPVSGYLRYRHFEIPPASEENNMKFETAGLVKKTKVGDGYIRVLEFDAVFEFLKEKLQNNFFYLLKKTPDFKNDEIPLI